MNYPRLPVGLGHATLWPSMDFETYSEAGYVWRDGLRKWVTLDNCTKYGLEAVGSAVYMEHPTTEVLSLVYDLRDGREEQLWVPDLPPPLDLHDAIARGVILSAWNSGFEWLAWNLVCTRRYGWPALPLEQLRCAMAKARAFGLPGALAKASLVVGQTPKDKALGDRVLKRYSMPRQITAKDQRRRITPQEDGLAAVDLYHYNIIDVRAETSVAMCVPDLSDFETQVWLLDQRINLRGIPIDMPLVQQAQVILEHMEREHNEELRALTDGHLTTYTEVAAMQRYLSDFWGVHCSSLDEEAIASTLAHEDIQKLPRRVLEIRQTMASAGVKKIHSMQRLASWDNRVRQLYTYHSAHTGRWAAGGIQPHNMKSTGPSLSYCKACDLYYHYSEFDCCRWCGKTDTIPSVPWEYKVMARVIDTLSLSPELVHRLYQKDTLGVMAASIRGFIQAPEGKEFVCSDYNAIEAVGLAMLAGEQWRIDVFRTHGKIYEASIAQTMGRTVEFYLEYRKQHGHHHPDRKRGKVRELAAGYSGWIGAWKNFGADEFMTEEEIKADVLAWRADSPMVVELWGGQWRKHPAKWEFTQEYYGLEGMAVLAVQHPGQWFTYRYAAFMSWNDVLYLRLPSGRHIAYHRPRLTEGRSRYGDNPIWQISYEGYNTNPNNGGVGWIRMDVTGGSLTNNLVQATCRDIFAHGMLNVEAAGYPVVLHTHDELISEVPEGFGSIDDYERAMMDLPDWCKDWPIKASGGWRGKRYRKD